MIYIFLFVMSVILTYFIKEYAIKKSLMDVPNERSSHTIATPHGGGIAIAVTWFIGITYLYYIEDINSSLFFALLAGTIISAVSFLDDIYELSAKLRLFVQAFVAFLGLYFLGGLDKIDLFYFTIENQIITNILAFVIIVWFINLYNFLDGIDGYAGSEAIFLGLAGFLLFGEHHFLILIAAVAGFLIWNWHKAKIFMGDVGSTLLGYNIAIFALYYQNGCLFENEGSSVLVWMILSGVFFFDATITLIRRYRNGEIILQAHKKHAYQRLTQAGWSHSKVVIYSIFVNIILFSIVYSISNIIFATLLTVVFLYSIIKYIDFKKAFN